MIRLVFVLLVLLGTCTANLRVLQPNGVNVDIQAWGANSARIRIGYSITEPAVQAMLPGPPSSIGSGGESTVFQDNDIQKLVSGNLEVAVSSSGEITATRLSDHVILFQELLRDIQPNGDPGLYTATFRYTAHPDERIYGLGEHRTGQLSYSNWTWPFQQSQTNYHNGDFTVPFYQSSVGFGVLWNLASFGHISITDQYREWHSNSTEQIDLWVTTTAADHHQLAAAPPYAALMRNYVQVTGHPPALPQFASGFWQCKNRYRNQTEILSVAKGYRDRNIPVSVIVVDYFHWDHYGDWCFDQTCWPDPSAMTAQLAEWGIKLMVSVWPHMSPDSPNFPFAFDKELLVKTWAGKQVPYEQFHGDDMYVYDAFNQTARQYMFSKVKAGYLQHNISVYWLDACEPEGSQPGNMLYTAGKDIQVGMAFAREHQRGIYEGLSQNVPQSEIISLSRSAWAGSQRYAAATWSGDINSTFAELAIQVKVAQNVAMSGIYWWTTDIGGYRGGNITDPVWRELIVRWFQFGAFCPIFRLHGSRLPTLPDDSCGFTGGYNEIWEFGEPAFGIISEIIRFRESLRPYVDAHLRFASQTGVPILRPMVFDFPDTECFDAVSQFMFGPEWLVAPVTEYQATTWRVYLPRLADGEHWMGAFSRRAYEGGQWLMVDVQQLHEFPLFHRERRG